MGRINQGGGGPDPLKDLADLMLKMGRVLYEEGIRTEDDARTAAQAFLKKPITGPTTPPAPTQPAPLATGAAPPVAAPTPPEEKKIGDMELGDAFVGIFKRRK